MSGGRPAMNAETAAAATRLAMIECATMVGRRLGRAPCASTPLSAAATSENDRNTKESSAMQKADSESIAVTRTRACIARGIVMTRSPAGTPVPATAPLIGARLRRRQRSDRCAPGG